MHLDILAELNRERAARRATLVISDLETGAKRLVHGEAVQQDSLAALLTERLRLGRSGVADHEGQRLFIAVQVPPVRLVVIGAVHIAQALAPMAAVAGLDLTVVDPRSAFAAPERFPECRVLTAWPEDALATLGLDRFTAVVALSHDPKIDDPALVSALRGACFYVGALGSRKSHAARCSRLGALGFGADSLSRIHAPIGLDIGAVSPAEIAISILGEIVLAMRRKPTRIEAAQQDGQAA